MTVTSLGGPPLLGHPTAIPGRLVVVPPGQVPVGAQVVAVVALVPDRGRRPQAGPARPGPRPPGRAAGTHVVPGVSDRTGRSDRPVSVTRPAVAAVAPVVAGAAGYSVGAAGYFVPASAGAGGPIAQGASIASSPGSAMAPARSARRIGPDLVLDVEGRLLIADGRDVELTRREFDLLAHLSTRPGRVFTRAQLLAAVWDPADAGYTGPRTVDVHIARLRRKLGDRHAAALATLRGVGYRWSSRPEATDRRLPAGSFSSESQ